MYIALYRQKRPQKFSEVVGQDAIVKTIKNQLMADRVSHAYLFSGSRGTGKTTMAKILSRAVNCLAPVDGEPCNQCDICRLIIENRSVDVVEMDAASNNGVDNIRDINEETRYPATITKKKVYIIDEVHMLSTGAFNALLKTLEEPPPHVLFILATTDPQKIPATVLSRCQRFDFKRIQTSDIEETLEKFLEDANYTYEEKAISLIAHMAEGSFRDGISILDQCMSFFTDRHITEALVRDIFGAVDNEMLILFSQSLYKKDTEKLLSLIETMVEDGRSLAQFTEDIIKHMRNILVTQVFKGNNSKLDYSKTHIEALEQQGREIPKAYLLLYMEVFSDTRNHMRYSTALRVLLEVAMFKIINHEFVEDQQGTTAPIKNQVRPTHDTAIEALYQKIQAQDRKIEALESDQKTTNIGELSPVNKPIMPEKPKAIPKDFEEIVGAWDQLKTAWGTAHMKFLIKTRMEYINNSLFLICENKVILTALKSKETDILEKLEGRFNKKVNISMISEDVYNQTYKQATTANDLSDLKNWIQHK